MADSLKRLKEDVAGGNEESVRELVDQLLAENVSVDSIMDAMTEGMNLISKKFSDNEAFVPELVMAGDAMKVGLSKILPLFEDKQFKYKGKILLGSVEGDLHDIGKSIIGSVLTGAGYEVVDLGEDVPVSVFVDKVKEDKPDLIGASAYMTTTTKQLPLIHEALGKENLRDKVKFIIGGASTSEEYVEWSGADGWAETAGAVVEEVERVLSGGACK